MCAEWPQSRGRVLQSLVVLTVWECRDESARNGAINHHSGSNMWLDVRKKKKIGTEKKKKKSKRLQNCRILKQRMTRSKKCALIENRLAHSGRSAPAGLRRQHLVSSMDRKCEGVRAGERTSEHDERRGFRLLVVKQLPVIITIIVITVAMVILWKNECPEKVQTRKRFARTDLMLKV